MLIRRENLMKKNLLKGLNSFVLTLLFHFGAAAHELKSGPNGGAFLDIGSHHLEMVLTEKNLKLFITGPDEKAVDVTNASGNAIILAGKKKIVTKLSPSGGHVMDGQILINEVGPYTIVVILKLASGESLRAKFKVATFISSSTLTNEPFLQAMPRGRGELIPLTIKVQLNV